ncbi:hypothetical protein V6N13_137071 [Hibiscus sabdariffa]
MDEKLKKTAEAALIEEPSVASTDRANGNVKHLGEKRSVAATEGDNSTKAASTMQLNDPILQQIHPQATAPSPSVRRLLK